MLFLLFASYMTQYIHTNPHFITKREGCSAFHKDLALDVLPRVGLERINSLRTDKQKAN